MSKEDAVQLASRVLAVYFSFWGLFDLAYLPERFYSLIHQAALRNVLSSSHYYYNMDLLIVVLTFVWSAALFLVAAWFYRNGLTIHRLLLGTENES